MFSFFTQRSATTATINGQAIRVEPKETLLTAALRAGIDFPHSCRVGGCAACKCRLLSGQVKELTESGYLLSDEELDQGYILACQSVPKSNIQVAVNMDAQRLSRSVHGRVIGQEQLTHDITRLSVQLDTGLPYKAGQFANLRLDTLPGISRSYSFASAPQADAQVSFFVRKVPGGLFSSHVHDQQLLGQPITVEGPQGDFWLRPANAPLLLIAGGSGLAPILALLQDAARHKLQRPVTLLFGARAERDLYALAEISAIAAQWPSAFQFIPVLSEAAADAAWTGARGLVTEQLAALLPTTAHAYLCGPPAMIDSCEAILRQHGVAREHIHTDRFTTQQDALAASA
ncbi:2Fe-2S iron-sulfur cluster-binding protein [Pseudomonas aeruginosa]|nr:2Fe-2S iron-sulfur cluster binding domain-containing protein [Pseudomonas aeruginosa]HCA5868787.1 2Fe-2S iron-sulfur cluster binding domain-containing protein [Pseudomonas aeruginosa]HCA7379846.1 2Fe-2S iron-sulfur cluster binding domain-containing protein [Pseudomonas aeruginosa]HCA7777405.1 2Fe-2S iron-sulfur cluster binding domain-containing protein [Pseudomonas aeruginosa]HCF1019503.1 2Fe-2S iron-sulfur cluster binding domain-containing protein [Pseudomonas aeruginosa]